MYDEETVDVEEDAPSEDKSADIEENPNDMSWLDALG